MAKFRVGQRVRIINASRQHYVGIETSITELPGCNPHYPRSYRLAVIDQEFLAETGIVKGALAHPEQLAPLVPPAEDAWASEKVKQVTKVQPVAPVPVWP